LVLIGGSPNPSEYEAKVKNTTDNRIVFPGYVYGDDTNILMKNAYAYVQPSLIEGLSPVILTVIGLGTPLICSDIVENKFICGNNATTFECGNIESLTAKIEQAIQQHNVILQKAADGQVDIKNRFNWDKITDQYIDLLNNKTKN
jgi:glycosyltransferase involved in cell wall biosynthesis